MLYTLENDILKITAHTHGGELHNIIKKSNNTEFLWTGDATYWKYHAPILFPFVGKVINNEYRIDGKTYSLPQHGLARISEFEMINKNNDEITFELKYTEESLKLYPYKFSLIINYKLINNHLKVTYSVKNMDDKKIYFSIGAHPAFRCPLYSNETLNDYYLELNENETASIKCLGANGHYNGERKDVLNNENIINLSKELFKDDALVFDNLKSNKVSIKSKNHNESLTMDFTGFPLMAFWSVPTGAPFVCLEPWFGHSDDNTFNGDFTEKPAIESLDVNNIFTCSYTLTIN